MRYLVLVRRSGSGWCGEVRAVDGKAAPVTECDALPLVWAERHDTYTAARAAATVAAGGCVAGPSTVRLGEAV